MKRRSFLRRAAVLPLPILLGKTRLSALSLPALASAMNTDDRVLVLLHLSGGNDGLNTVIPLDQYAGLMSVRADVVIPENRVLPITDTLGLHPSFAGVRDLYNAGKVSIIQGVGYPEQNRSHFRSTDIMNTASASDEVLTTGWLGRYLDTQHPNYPDGYPSAEQPDPFAIVMGNTVSETCQGQTGNFSMALNGIENVGQLPVFEGSADLSLPYGRELDWLRTTISQSNQYAGAVEVAAGLGNTMADYPENNPVAAKLRDVARLISGGLKTKIYVVELGGFDTHAHQVVTDDTTVGVHADLLRTLSDAVAAFQNDLVALGLEQRVLGMTYSEFGRRVHANASAGTDHGDAAPMFLFGACVSGGVTGANVEVPTDIDAREGSPMQYDFRNVYGSVLMDWFGVERADVRSLVVDEFDYIPVLTVCRATSVHDGSGIQAVEFSVRPNPAADEVTVVFQSSGERVKITLFDLFGRRLRVVSDGALGVGEQRVSVSLRGLPAGTYFVHLQMAGGARGSRRVVRS